MKLNAAMMCVAAALLSFPFPAYIPYWLFGLSVLAELVLAYKLSSVTTLLAGQALYLYGDGAEFGRAESTVDAAEQLEIDLEDYRRGDAAAPGGKSAIIGGGGGYYGGIAVGAAAAPAGAFAPAARGGGKAVESPFADAAAAPYGGGYVNGGAGGAPVPGGAVRAYNGGGGVPASALAGPGQRVYSYNYNGTAGALDPLPPPALKPVRTHSPTAAPHDAAAALSPPAAAPAPAPAPAQPAAPLDTRAITRRIERCKTLQELEDFVAAHGGAFNQIHVSLALLQLHKLAERRGNNNNGSGGDANANANGSGEDVARADGGAAAAPDQHQRPPPQHHYGGAGNGGGGYYDYHPASMPSALRQQPEPAEDFNSWRRAAAAAGPPPGAAAGAGAYDGRGGTPGTSPDLRIDVVEVPPGYGGGAGGYLPVTMPGAHQRDGASGNGFARASDGATYGGGYGRAYAASANGHGHGSGAAAYKNPLARSSSLGGYSAGGGPPSPSARSIISVISSRRRSRVMARVEALPQDPSKLFWFGKPGLLIHVFQYVFYCNAFLLTLASFAFWQKHASDWIYEGVGLVPTLLLMGGSILLAIHSALRVLPQFALIEPLGRHCPEEVLRRALKEGGLKPEEAAALAAQLGVELPAPKKGRLRRRLSWRGGANGDEDVTVRAGRVLRRLLSLSEHKAPASAVGASGGGAGGHGASADADEPLVAPRSASVGGGHGGGHHHHDAHHAAASTHHRRSLEEIKSASMADLLRLLPGAEGGAAAGAGAHGGASGPASLARASIAASLHGDDGADSQHGGGGGHGSGGGGHGGGGGANASSNVELAGEMLRALILKQARAGQPVTPRSGAD